MESRKRKRELDEPRIKYHVQQLGRSFERILKENSREELCEVVRKKLELDSKTNLELVQVRDGVVYDLEDDEDFEAFRAAAHAYLSLDVRVSFSTDVVSQNASDVRAGASSMSKGSSKSPTAQGGRQRKAAKKRVSIAEQDKQVQGLLVSSALLDVGSDESADGNRSDSKLPSPSEEMTTPERKKRKRDVVKMDTATAEGGKKKKEQTKANEPAVQAHESVASVGGESPPRKKRKMEKKVESYKASTPAHDAHVLPLDSSDTTNTKSKKSKSKKSLSDVKDASTQSYDHVAQTPQVDKGNKLPADTENSIKKRSAKTSTSAKAVPDLAPPSSLSETGNVSTSVDITDVGASAKKPSAKKRMPVKATSDSVPSPTVTRAETLPRLSVSQTPSADSPASTVDTVRLAYASFFSKPPRTASELLANYYGTAPKAESRSNLPKSEPTGEIAVVPTTSTSTAEPKTKRKSSEVAVVENSGQDKQKPKVGKSRLRKSWVPVDPEEENPSQPSAKESSAPESSKVSDAAILPPPLTTQSTSVSRPLSSMRGRNEKKPTSISKLASPCPICLSFPFHLQFQCPVIQSGADAILGRMEQLKAESGQADLISELEEWVRKDRKKSKGKEVAKIDTMTRKKASRLATGQSEYPSSPLPAWAPVVSLQSHPSEVLVESTNEGSESAISSSSEVDDDQSKTGSSTESSSSLASEAKSLSINLEDVDLDALMRGPVLKNPSVELSKLVDEAEEEGSNEHTEGDGAEDDLGLLEEEEEEEKPLPKRLRGMNPLRSISPETASDEDDDSVSGSGLKAVADPSSLRSSQSVETGEYIQKVPSLPMESSVSDTSDSNKSQPTIIIHSEVSAHTDPGPRPEPGEHHATSTNTQPSLPTPPLTTPRVLWKGDDSSETTSTDPAKEDSNDTPLVTPPEIPSAQESSSEGLPNAETPPPSRATTPIRSNAPPSKTVPDTPRTVQRMKDRHGNLPINPPDDEVGIVQPALESTRDIPQVIPDKSKDDTLENPQQETPISPSQPMSPNKPVSSRTEIAPAKAKDSTLEKNQQGESRATSQSSPATSVLPRSVTGAPSVRSQSAEDVSPGSQPAVKRGRGRPPLTDAVKAERKAIRDAEKAAKAAQKAAEKQAKEPKTKSTSRSRQSKSHAASDETKEITSSSGAGASVVTPVPASQWTALQSVTTSSSAVSHSSPAIDELMSSSPSKQRTRLNKASDEGSGSSPTFGRLDGVKAPRSPSGSRKLDEEDVEQIIGSSEGVPAAKTPVPLFLPGASEFSQSQIVPQFAALASEKHVQNEGGLGSSSEEEDEDDDGDGPKSTVSRLPLASRPSFPSLSQLSFEKFKPSFLLTNVFSQSQSTAKHSAVPSPEDNDSEEDEEESTDTERESHIPKDKRAGIRIGKRSKRRGLLH